MKKIIVLNHAAGTVNIIYLKDEHDWAIEDLTEVVEKVLIENGITPCGCDWMELETDEFGNFTTIEIHE